MEQRLTRDQKAMRLLEANCVHLVHPSTGVWRVDSESDPDVSYVVNLAATPHTCECPDFQRRHLPCKHILACEKYIELSSRPTPKPKITLDQLISQINAAHAARAGGVS